MRMRTKTWARPELNDCEYFIKTPEGNKGKWHNQFERKQPLHLELGCGKGLLVAGLAAENSDINFLAVDISMDIMGVARRNIAAVYADRPVDNLLLSSFNIVDIDTVLAPQDKVSRIYIYFCNPWGKPRHKKRRLTHTRQLLKYRQFLEDGGEIYFRTDDLNLFRESFEYFSESGFKIKLQTEDFYNSQYNAGGILSEHEIKFMQQGVSIKFLIAEKLP